MRYILWCLVRTRPYNGSSIVERNHVYYIYDIVDRVSHGCSVRSQGESQHSQCMCASLLNRTQSQLFIGNNGMLIDLYIPTSFL